MSIAKKTDWSTLGYCVMVMMIASVSIVDFLMPISVESAYVFANLFLFLSHCFFLHTLYFIAIKHLSIFHGQFLADVDENDILFFTRVFNFAMGLAFTIIDMSYNNAGNRVLCSSIDCLVDSIL